MGSPLSHVAGTQSEQGVVTEMRQSLRSFAVTELVDYTALTGSLPDLTVSSPPPQRCLLVSVVRTSISPEMYSEVLSEGLAGRPWLL